MAVPIEAINTILDFYPRQPVTWGERINLGRVGETSLFYGFVTYPQRARSGEGEPLTGRITTQPVVALEKPEVLDLSTGKPGIIALSYATEITTLGEELVLKVADYLKALSQR